MGLEFSTFMCLRAQCTSTSKCTIFLDRKNLLIKIYGYKSENFNSANSCNCFHFVYFRFKNVYNSKSVEPKMQILNQKMKDMNRVIRPSEGGRLQVKRYEFNGEMLNTLCDQNGKHIQLRGMSTHGLSWYPKIINNNAFNALSTFWKCNVIRLSMYVNEEKGYKNLPELNRRLVWKGIYLACKNDMYVIVDWHVLNPGDPRDKVYNGARDFFKQISKEFHNCPNIIYEICNEPNNAEGNGIPNDAEGWKLVKEYAIQIIKELRESDNHNLIIVGSPQFSQLVNYCADDQIDPKIDQNIMYAFHFYAAEHKKLDDPATGSIFPNLQKALDKGIGIFVSEWGTTKSDGETGYDRIESNKWLDFLDENNISWCNWSLSDKKENSAAIKKINKFDPGPYSDWATSDLSKSGNYVRRRIKKGQKRH